MNITEAEKMLMNEIQHNLRKEDNILAKCLSYGNLSENEHKLTVELQGMIRTVDRILNYFLNSEMIPEQHRDRIITNLLDYPIVDYLISNQQTKQIISYENFLENSISTPKPMTIPVAAPATMPEATPETTPATTPNSKLESIFSEEISLEPLVSRLLVELGIPAHINGYTFMRTGFILLINGEAEAAYVTKYLYPEIAKRHKTTSNSVERCIRHAIEVAWNRGDIEILDNLFGYSISSDKGKPTNSEFIFTIADYIRFHRKNPY